MLSDKRISAMLHKILQHMVIILCIAVSLYLFCVYTDRSSPPENITIQSISAGSINITWDAESVAGVDQYYNINFTSNMSSIRLTKPFLSL